VKNLTVTNFPAIYNIVGTDITNYLLDVILITYSVNYLCNHHSV